MFFSVLLLIFYVYDDVDIDIDDEFVLMLMLLMCSNTITPKSAEVDEDLHNLGLPIGRGQPHHYKIANIKVRECHRVPHFERVSLNYCNALGPFDNAGKLICPSK